MDVITGRLDASAMRFGIVVSRFNGVVAERLLDGAVDALVRHGADRDAITIVWVPGSMEIAIAALELAEEPRIDAVVCLGVVIRGETPHFDYVAGEASRGVASAMLATRKPVSFGVLTTETMEQAVDRAGGKHGNKGSDAAITAVEMVSVLRGLRARRAPRRASASA